MNTVIEITNINQLPTVGSDVYIPSGSLVDIQIGVSGWWLLAQGKTLNMVANSSGWIEGLNSSGLQVQNIDSTFLGTDIVFHCKASQDVFVSAIDLSGHEIQYAGIGGEKIVSLIMWGVILALGITAGITYFKVSSNNLVQVQVKENLAQILNSAKNPDGSAKYTPDQILKILEGVNPAPDPFAGMVKYIAIGAIVMGTAILAGQVAPLIPKRR